MTEPHIEMLVIPADITYAIYTAKYSLKKIQVIVGGYVECVVLPKAGNKISLWCNADGKLLNLPRNKRASIIYGVAHTIEFVTDYIVGDVCVTGGVNSEGDIKQLPPDAHKMILDLLKAQL